LTISDLKESSIVNQQWSNRLFFFEHNCLEWAIRCTDTTFDTENDVDFGLSFSFLDSSIFAAGNARPT
jgi:hypothetical protein